ncbi:MAG: NADH-quinone oxidoreductase subunit C [Chloroflexi bacterium]|nr:NADH-quinone oxidoreductase subunit C [Chloroflexota bacterium]
MPRPRRNAPEADADPPPDPIELLSVECRATLDRAVDLLGGFSPVAGTLGDLPQVTIPSTGIVDACATCRDHEDLDCRMLLCLACVDHQERFDLVYFLQSLALEKTLVIRTAVPYDNPVVSTVTGIWPAADWYEREAHDLFGVSFSGHPDLSPLLLYPEFEGYPGRKEYDFNDYREF